MKWRAFGLLVALFAPVAHAQELVLRHALEGQPLRALVGLTERFNHAQKGRAKVVLRDSRGGNDRPLPQLAFLDADDGAEFFGVRPRFKPLHQVMAAAGERFDRRRFYPAIAAAVDDRAGRLQALPLGMALPVLMWNKQKFQAAGLDPDSAPATWWEVQRVAGKLVDHGDACPLTTSRFAWVHLENLSSQHNAPMLGASNRAALNGLVNVKHIALLSSWYKSSYFRYYGPRQEGDRHFLSGECAMLTGESSLYTVAREAGLQVGIADLPHYDDVHGAAPRNVLPDGAALWVLDGAKKEDYRVAARFVSFLMQPQSQREWVKATAYLPMGPEAMKALHESSAPAVLVEAAERRLAAPKVMARPRMDGAPQSLRDILGEEMEFVWRNEKPAKEALDTAMQRVNGARVVR